MLVNAARFLTINRVSVTDLVSVFDPLYISVHLSVSLLSAPVSASDSVSVSGLVFASDPVNVC